MHTNLNHIKYFFKGLNPKENRNIPPLKYDYVVALKRDFPHLNFSINGGFKTAKQVFLISIFGINKLL